MEGKTIVENSFSSLKLKYFCNFLRPKNGCTQLYKDTERSSENFILIYKKSPEVQATVCQCFLLDL